MVKFTRALDYLRNEAPELNLNSLTTFLLIASSGDSITITKLSTDLELPLATASRHVQALGDGNFKKTGLGWVESIADERDQRVKLVRLTSKGESVVKTIQTFLK